MRASHTKFVTNIWCWAKERSRSDGILKDRHILRAPVVNGRRTWRSLGTTDLQALEQHRMLFQPSLRRLVIRAAPLDFAPEPRRVVHLLQVRQFVQNQVVANKWRRLNEPPVQ